MIPTAKERERWDKTESGYRERASALTPEEWRQIMRGELTCPICQGSGVLYYMQDTGVLSAPDCKCASLKAYWEIVQRLPVKFRSVSLYQLQPSTQSGMPLEDQQALYDEIRTNPFKGYALFSPAGWSKTTVCTALYKYVLFDRVVTHPADILTTIDASIGVWRVSTPVLIQQYQDYITGRITRLPDVTVRKIMMLNRKKIAPRLFLEEIDKFKLTEFAQNEVFKLVNTMYEAEGQLVINSNLTLAEFDSQFGSAISRRVAEMCEIKSYHEE
jgi:DNA replication protein DnaC